MGLDLCEELKVQFKVRLGVRVKVSDWCRVRIRSRAKGSVKARVSIIVLHETVGFLNIDLRMLQFCLYHWLSYKVQRLLKRFGII